MLFQRGNGVVVRESLIDGVDSRDSPSDLPPGATNVRIATVRLDRPAEGDTFVVATSSDATALVVAAWGALIPEGQTSADVLATVVRGEPRSPSPSP